MTTPYRWFLQPQTQPGDYWFSGRLVLTPSIQNTLSSPEVSQIIRDLFIHVRHHQGADFIQTFRDDQGRTILCVDQLSASMKASGAYTPSEIQQNDFWIMLFAHDH